MNPLYFDHNATTPLADAAKTAWLDVSQNHWINPSSPYRAAAAVKVRLDAARAEAGELLKLQADRIVFCSGATEANNAVFENWAHSLPKDSRVAVSPIEHPSVIGSAKSLFGDRVVWLALDSQGRVDLGSFEKLLQAKEFSAASVMAANNETGVIQPWREIAQLCQKAAVPYHCDASQWVGKMDADGLGLCGYVTACGHKFGGPKGTGILVISDPEEGFHLLYGGDQESGHRAGTEDVAGAYAMVAALRGARAQDSSARDAFVSDVQKRIEGIEVVGSGADRLWNTVSLIMPEFQSARWVRALEKLGFIVSSGSACATGKAGASHVLLAMGIDASKAGRVVRLSSGSEADSKDWTALADAFVEAHAKLNAETLKSKSRVISLD